MERALTGCKKKTFAFSSNSKHFQSNLNFLSGSPPRYRELFYNKFVDLLAFFTKVKNAKCQATQISYQHVSKYSVMTSCLLTSFLRLNLPNVLVFNCPL